MKPNNLLKRLTTFETILSAFLFFMPLILILVNKEVRPSISNFAYSEHNQFFVVLLSLAGVMFIYNALLNEQRNYNYFLGFSIIGVAMTPHLHYPIMHYGFAIIFFIGSVFAMVVYSSTKQRFYKIIAGLLIILAIIFHYAFNVFSLLVAEWIGLLPICLHFIGESNNKID